MLAGDIGTELVVPGATLTFHLKELVRTGLISAEAKGRTMRYRADYEAMSKLLGYLTENCCAGEESCPTAASTERVDRPSRRAD